MAICLPGPIVTAISGDLGACCFYAGKRATVVGRKRRPGAPSNSAQLHWRALVAEAGALWGRMTDSNKTLWNQWAKAFPAASRLGPSRRLSGRAALISYLLFADPSADLWYENIQPPWGLMSAPFPIVTPEWHAGGPYEIVLQSPAPTTLFCPWWVRRHLEYGPRTSQNATFYLGEKGWNSGYDENDLKSLFDAAGITLVAGETLRLRWSALYSRWYPPPATLTTITVLP